MEKQGSPTKECILGIDLGATSLRIARVDAAGGEFFSTPTPSSLEAEEVLSSAICTACRGQKVLCAGLSRAPGINAHGHITDWPSRPDWAQLPLIPWLQLVADAPTVSADDGFCAGLWEHRARTNAPENCVTACVSIGTGLAVGIVTDNKAFATGDGAATLSHECFEALDLLCRCGRRGCLQTALSVEGLEKIIATGKIEKLQGAFQEFEGILKSRYNVDLVVISGGGVARFGTRLLFKILANSIYAGVAFGISSTPALSGMGGALLLAADCNKAEPAVWRERVRNFIQRESENRQEFSSSFAEAATA